MNISVKKLYPDAVIPTFGSADAAGADLYAYIPGDKLIDIHPHCTVKIGTGVAMAIPSGYWGGVFARSGLATKKGLAPANKVGVVDPDYRGEIIVALHNDTDEIQNVSHGDRIGQLVIVPVPAVTYVEAAELDDTVRGCGGFGHTGV